MHRTLTQSASASLIASPELIRYARLRRFGLPAATARVIAVLAFGEVPDHFAKAVSMVREGFDRG